MSLSISQDLVNMTFLDDFNTDIGTQATQATQQQQQQQAAAVQVVFDDKNISKVSCYSDSLSCENYGRPIRCN